MIELQGLLRRIEEGKPLETDDVPELGERQRMMLAKADVQALKAINAPQERIKISMALWLLLLDSFGFEVTAKAKSTITEASLTAGTYRAKAQKYSQLCSWTIIQTQLKDIKLLPKL